MCITVKFRSKQFNPFIRIIHPLKSISKNNHFFYLCFIGFNKGIEKPLMQTM